MLPFASRGSGAKVVLLVHGFLGTGRNLMSLARRLAETRPDWQVLLPDLRGHGSSLPLGRDDGIEVLAADILALAQAQGGGQPVSLIGHSLGGRVALAALAQAPQAFDQVTLLDISPSPLPSLTGAMQRLFERLMGAPAAMASREEMRAFFLAGGLDAGLTDWAMTNLVVAPAGQVHWRIDRAALAQLHWRETGDDLWAAAQAHGDKLRCIAGGASAFVSAADAERLRDCGASVQVLAGAGHFLHVDALNPLVELLTQPAAEAL